MSFFNGGVNNSKLTPEFNRQGNAATDGNNDAKDNQVQEGTIDNVDNNPNVTEGNNNQPTQTNDNVYAYDENEVFNSPEEIMEALREARNLASQRENDFKNLQRDYTKKSQRLAFLDKMGNRNERVNNVTPNVGAQTNQMFYNNNNQQDVIPDFNSFMYGNNFAARNMPAYQRPVAQQPVVDASIIQMAADQAVMELKAQDADFDEVAPVLWDVIENDPYFAGVQFTDIAMTKNTIGLAYQMAKNKINQARANININNAKNEAYKNKQQKLVNNDNSANVAGGQNKRQANKKTDEDMIKDSIIGAKPNFF